MSDNLYLVINSGCDDHTKGLVAVSEEDFPKFREFVENLNKNSYYGCMPVIRVYKIDMENLKEIEWPACDEEVDRDEVLYFNDKTYTLTDKDWWYDDLPLELVIKAERGTYK